MIYKVLNISKTFLIIKVKLPINETTLSKPRIKKTKHKLISILFGKEF